VDRVKAATPSVLLRLAVFSAAWWIFVEGDLRSPLLALAMIVLATGSSLAILPAGRPLDAIGLVGLVPFFLRQSILGGIDVLRRAVHPALPLRPGFYDLPLHVSGEPARALVASITSLLPGSLSVELHERRMRVHVLDTAMPVPEVVRSLERHAARVFSEPSPPGRA
jgi:multicomponent Na+:H+ antiporter subunit E